MYEGLDIKTGRPSGIVVKDKGPTYRMAEEVSRAGSGGAVYRAVDRVYPRAQPE